MKKFFKNRKVPFGILSYSSSAPCTANKIFQQGLKKEYLTSSLKLVLDTISCGDST